MLHQHFYKSLTSAIRVGALLSLLVAPALAEDLNTVDWFEREVGNGVVWRYYRFDSLFGSKQSITYIEADLGNPAVSVEFPYLAASRQATSSMIPGQFPNAVAGCNGTYFDTAAGGGGHRSYLRINNTEIPWVEPRFSGWGWDSGIAKTAADAVSIVTRPGTAGGTGWTPDVTHPDILSCGPQLIKASVIDSSYLTGIGSHCTGRHPRTAAGITSTNKLILVVADGRTDDAAGMTCVETGQLLEMLGVTDGFNLDGGGSSTIWAKGEPYSGVVNYPSDNGAYDHLGQRSCSNAIAVVSSAATPVARDARVNSITFNGTMIKNETQTVTISYKNIGTETWTAADTRMVTSRPTARVSAFYTSGSWVSTSVPATMTPASVAPNGTATFQFTVTAPEVALSAIYEENFQLEKVGVGRFGPANNEARFKVVVYPTDTSGATNFLIEPRVGGQNFTLYTDSGMADTAANCTAPGATGTIGMRYGSTYVSVAGSKYALWSPTFPQAGNYRVYVAWGSGSNRRTPITYHVTHAGGIDTFQLDQSSTSNVWMQLGTEFAFAAGASGSVRMTNEDIDLSGSMYAGPVKFEFVPAADVTDWCLY
ncbi:hypothetical protein CVU37_02885 [candidate division BRC1 bacterium HGW-BRC1-1]|jgi:hypothetical protein|nr:MAG: hypothetical protein CVU37_02885 [candidate division BRC1 bacterium HGW-BRC1-1]